MSTCTKWVDTFVITCKNWASELDQVCTSWADEGSNQCSEWADEGSSQCTSWEECHWYTPWDCIAGFFCRAYYWVAKWVCKAYYWVAKWVCKVFAWIVKAVCVVFSWVLQLVCVAWDTLRCAALAIINLITSLFGRGRQAPKIQHVFVLMLENRSFDHMLGFSGISGVDPAGNPTEFNHGFDPATTGNTNPADNAFVKVSTGADFYLKGIDDDPGHEFENTVVALCGDGVTFDPTQPYPPIHNSGFIANYHTASDPTRVMRCFDPCQLPIITTLAKEFAVCDHWYSSLPGPTWPNRFFFMAGTSGGLDGSPSSWDVVTSTTVEGYRFQNGNVFDQLDANCVPWHIYRGDDFPVAFALKGMNLNELQGRLSSYDDFAADVSKTGFPHKFVFIEPQYGESTFDVTGPGDFACGNSMHPLDDVTRGEALIKKTYEAIRNSPHWEHSLLLVTFDEHGGFFDHKCPPPATPPGDLQTASYVQHGFRFDRLGVRVPALVISPFTPKGVIDHTQYDHTSMLKTIQKIFGMGSLTNRDAAAEDFLKLAPLTTARANAPTQLPPIATVRPPLDCGKNADESKDTLLLKRSRLRLARAEGQVEGRKNEEFPLRKSQVGFLQIALLKALQTAEGLDRKQWIEDYKAIRNGVDAALFMSEAKLKVIHGIDVKRNEREAANELKRTPRRMRH
jgi:phospholipase C